MPVSRRVQDSFARASWIRRMFEEGLRLKAEHGPDNVYDFSLGNPDQEPPPAFKQVLRDLAAEPGPGWHAYMPNAGYPRTRERVADWMSRLHGLEFSSGDVVMTPGAAGALNIILKTLLDPHDEVVVPRPCFLEYDNYLENHGAVVRPVALGPDFSLDTAAIAGAIGPSTRAVLINSPHNPTGRVYPVEQIETLAEVLCSASERLGRPVYLISDEPYRRLVYDGVEVPSIFTAYQDSLVATSFSKDLSVPGERIGFAAVHPGLTDHDEVLAGLGLCMRNLGYVNAPAFMQRAIAEVLDEQVDVTTYRRRRDLLCDGLSDSGYEFARPQGAFYLFPRSPLPDDVALVGLPQQERILVVPGTAFGAPGYFRIAYCVDERTIEGAMPGFRRVREQLRD